jgi:ribosomal protein S18 acetylase RimI-like enzyme
VSTRLRRAAPGDEPALLDMMADFNAAEGIALEPQRLAAALDRLVGDESLGRVWVVERDGEVCGYAVLTWGYDLEWGGRDSFLTEIYVRRDARGVGVGRAALAAVEDEARAAGAGALHLMVRPENTAAVRLYAAAGYQSPPRVLLSKRLAP